LPTRCWLRWRSVETVTMTTVGVVPLPWLPARRSDHLMTLPTACLTASLSISLTLSALFVTVPPPPPIGEQSTSFGWGKGGSVTSAGWQVTLCDHMWHVSSRCGVATLRTAIHLCVCLFVGDYINGTACPRSPPNFCACCLWPRSDLSLAALRYVMYFRFTDGVIQLAIP